MKKIIYVLVLSLITITLNSCSKWLDIKPDDQIYPEEKFNSSEGFQQTLSGIYNYMSSPTLYGRELEYGFLDILAGYWNIGSYNTHRYYNDNNYDYTNTIVKDRIDSVWIGLYSSIRQVNIVLENVDNIKNDVDYNIIKGEALGLRGFLHLELFKLFGPIVKTQGLQTISIPYYTQVTKVPNPFLISKVFLDQVENDLQAAAILLKDDPIIKLGRAGNGNDGDFFSNYNYLLDRRGVRMNYYAVKSLLARKSLWEGDLQSAGARAQEVISELATSKAITLIEKANIENNYASKDKRFSIENILGLFVNKHNLYTRRSFEVTNSDLYTRLAPQYNQFLSKLYTEGTGNTNDYRLNNWNISTDYFSKFNLAVEYPGDIVTYPQHYEVQLINLPELYFIVSEANLTNNPKLSVEYINKIRAVRNIPELSTQADSNTAFSYLMDEIRREYIGEGMLFTYYKRWNSDIIRYDGNKPASPGVFVLPKPAEEDLFNISN
ncbi:RagB/SusD family nutrient uptake outer membrane protein [Sphingobacterium bovistauri]|uniref:RagB/SusD family nutrient uptake outer membrane protein n=1 Tax=Sphingobacterium bovistauri TaxID=2781959 RepID=A0ABS7Z673_9SPHI|nr:RagB/SusD family nutrient uptake outer membrane protein [Sphingobacterium bovistauri]MCA5005693.1 RagB/SusD family nutrient uptake outer membrane protein [Sphingobacterium bovistauri]